MMHFFSKIQWNLYKCLNKSNRLHLKMETNEEIDTAIVASLLVKKMKNRKRSMWVKPWLGRKSNLGLHKILVQELRFEDESK